MPEPSLLAGTPVLILAGGTGTRLRPALPDHPKGLAPIGVHSFLEIQMQLLRGQGARQFVLCVGHQADQIQAALGDGHTLDVQIEYSVEAPGRLLGTAGALKLAEGFFKPRALVLNGDTYFDVDYASFLRGHLDLHARCGILATVALTQLEDRSRYGSVVLDHSGSFIRAFNEKNTSTGTGWASGGAYVIERGLLERIPLDQPYSLEYDVFPRTLDEGGTLAAMTFTDRFFDIGTPEAWKSFADHYRELQNGGHR